MKIATGLLALAALATDTPVPPGTTAAWTAEQRATIDKVLKRAGVSAVKTKADWQDARRMRGAPVALMRGVPLYPRYQLEEDVHGCVLVSFEILPDGKTDQFEVVSAEPAGVFDTLAVRMMLHTTFERPAPQATPGSPPRHQMAVFVLLPRPPPTSFSRINQFNETERDKKRAELRAACEAQAP